MAAEKQANPKKKVPPLPKKVERSCEEEEAVAAAPKATAKKKATPAKVAKNGRALKKRGSEDEGEAPPPKAMPLHPPSELTPAVAHPTEDDEHDDEDGEAEMDSTPSPVAKAKKAGMVKDKKDDREEEEGSKDGPALTPGKRKARPKEEGSPAKQAKPETTGRVQLHVSLLNRTQARDLSRRNQRGKEALANFFSENNLEIQNVRLGSSKKFGYVDFATEDQLQTALELHGKKVLGQNVRLDKAKHKATPQEAQKERDARTLFVKNVPFSATKEDLKQVFAQAIQIRVPTGNTGSNKGIAYMEFKSKAVAEQVLEEKQGADVQGSSVVMDFIRDQSQKEARVSAAAPPSKTLMVNNLVYSASEETLQKTFEKAVSIRIPLSNGRPKGFAFVEFGDAEDSREALQSLNGVEVEGRPVRLEFCRSQYEEPELGRPTGPTKTLFVKGLSKDTTDETLRESFEGAIAARVATAKDTGTSKGFGFVDFDNEEFCKASREAMEDCEIDGSKVVLDFARPKGEGAGRARRGTFSRGVGSRGGRGGRRGNRGGFGGRGGGFRGKPRGKKMKLDE
ncbi:hypothetical protein AAFF_G00068540 [Aldrovandia affinis]|uniref:Nucleolin n=1 Tax=Aldrovandia affinis TaxID=143900 RepID=A0AAD7S1U5_9TELE|nr:hypothetical protein AAFF_G00068540 [Aldrovandia affinis]